MRILVKLVSELTHAEMLLKGCLYMRPASYYHNIKNGQGDIREGWLSNKAMIYQNHNLPIYCMCLFHDGDIINNKISISARCIEDFKCKDGYAVILDASEFEKRLPNINRNGYRMAYGEVIYKEPLISDIAYLIKNEKMENLFIKHPYFSYQKEYRIVIGEPVYNFMDMERKDHVIYKFPENLRDIGYIESIKGNITDDGNLLLPMKAR